MKPNSTLRSEFGLAFQVFGRFHRLYSTLLLAAAFRIVVYLRKHEGVSLSAAEEFDIDTAMVSYDDRAAPEDRWVAVGFIGAVLHVLVFTERNGRIRPISLRKAEKPEVRHYEAYKARYGV